MTSSSPAVSLLALASLMVSGCITAPATKSPVLKQVGDTVYRYANADLELTVGATPARMAVGRHDWLVLDLGVSGTRRIVTRLDREGLMLELPDGRRYPLAEQKDLLASYDGLEPFLRRAAVASPPIDYYLKDRRSCPVPFFAPPGRGTVANILFVNDRQYCVGQIFFHLRDVVQPGRYRLVVVTDRAEGLIPFELP